MARLTYGGFYLIVGTGISNAPAVSSASPGAAGIHGPTICLGTFDGTASADVNPCDYGSQLVSGVPPDGHFRR
jgi:hypothetical protein